MQMEKSGVASANQPEDEWVPQRDCRSLYHH